MDELASRFEVGQIPLGDAAKQDYVELYNTILRLKNILVSFDDFAGNQILTDSQLQDFDGTYLEIYRELRDSTKGDRESILDSITFEIELVKSVDITVDYILELVAKWLQAQPMRTKKLRFKSQRLFRLRSASKAKKT